MNKARVLITRECLKDCQGCCNNYNQIMKGAQYINHINELPFDLDEILITGGEPLLRPSRTFRIVKTLAANYPDSKLYLYSAFYSPALEVMIPYLNGLHYTIHKNETAWDIELFNALQDLLTRYKRKWAKKSFRLYIENGVKIVFRIKAYSWSNIRITKWLTEKELLEKQPNGLPLGESLYILDDSYL